MAFREAFYKCLHELIHPRGSENVDAREVQFDGFSPFFLNRVCQRRQRGLLTSSLGSGLRSTLSNKIKGLCTDAEFKFTND